MVYIAWFVILPQAFLERIMPKLEEELGRGGEPHSWVPGLGWQNTAVR